MVKVLIVIGSLREKSFNKELALEAKKTLEQSAEVSILKYDDLPLFNQDLEQNPPYSVKRIREEVKSADGIFFFTPEYNGSVSGVLKNFLDWMSRSIDLKDRTNTAIRGKKVAVAGVGGMNKTNGSQTEVIRNLKFIGAKVLDEHYGFALPGSAFATGSWEIEDSVKDQIKKESEAFLKFID